MKVAAFQIRKCNKSSRKQVPPYGKAVMSLHLDLIFSEMEAIS